MVKVPIYQLGYKELENAIDWSAPYRFKQVADWIFKKNVPLFSDMSNVPKYDLNLLEGLYDPSTIKVLKETHSERTPTKKYLLETYDHKKIEAVLIPDLNERFTLCLSSQVGCSFQCAFCATGTMRLERNLLANEIIEQFAHLNYLNQQKIKNIVFMGMGEPFANQNEVFKAIKNLIDPLSFGLSPSRISVSTSGVLAGIERFSNELPKCWLLISLHSAIQEKRDKLMPNVVGQKLTQLKETLKKYQYRTEKEVTLEYIMLQDINDQKEDVEALIAFTKGLEVKVNLIAYNVNPGLGFEPSSSETIEEFKMALEASGLTVVQRYKKGDDIAAACGQLVVAQK